MHSARKDMLEKIQWYLADPEFREGLIEVLRPLAAEVEQVEILRFEPDDVLVLTVPSDMKSADLDNLRAAATMGLPDGLSVIVKPSDITLEIVRVSKEESSETQKHVEVECDTCGRTLDTALMEGEPCTITGPKENWCSGTFRLVDHEKRESEA